MGVNICSNASEESVSPFPDLAPERDPKTLKGGMAAYSFNYSEAEFKQKTNRTSKPIHEESEDSDDEGDDYFIYNQS